MSRGTPFDDLERMFEQMTRQFEDASRQWQQWGGMESRGEAGAADVVDRGDAFEVVVELPGYEAGDVDLRVVDRTLSIDAERTEETEVGDDQFVRHERSHQSVSRQVQLPDTVDPEGVEATMERGLLEVTLPKSTPADRGHSIDVE